MLPEERRRVHARRVQDRRHERRQRDHRGRPRDPRAQRAEVLRRPRQHAHLRTILARRVPEFQLREQGHQRWRGVRLPRHHAGERACVRTRPLDPHAHEHERSPSQPRSRPAALQHVCGRRVLPAPPDVDVRLSAPGGPDPGRGLHAPVRHGPESVHDHRLRRVRSRREQHGRGSALRADRHRGLPAAARLELRPDHHLLSDEETAMRYQPYVAPLVLAVGFSAVACTDLLNEDPKGFTTTDTFFQTGADLNSATLAIYSALRGLEGQSNWTTPELASDQARADNREPNAGTYGPDRLNWSADAARATLVLANGPGITTPDAATKAYNIAEAKFLRGYAYLRLTKAYDGVPLLLSPEDQANPSPTRAPVDSVHLAVIDRKRVV